MENPESLLGEFNNQVIKSIWNVGVSFFFFLLCHDCFGASKLELSRNTREQTLPCILTGSFFYGNDYGKGSQTFSAAVLLVWDLFLLFCSCVLQDVAQW